MKKRKKQDSYHFMEDERYESYKERSSRNYKKRVIRQITKIGVIVVSVLALFTIVHNVVFPFISSASGDNIKLPKDNMVTSVYSEDDENTEETSIDSSKTTNTKRRMVSKDPDNIKTLINKQIFLPEGYKADDLVVPDVKFSFSHYEEKKLMREEAAKALEDLFEASSEEGLSLCAISGFRSYERQYNIFTSSVRRYGLEETLKESAMPGSSEHQTGLAMDVSTEAVSYSLTTRFETTSEGKWLADNAHRFGYIIRYPDGKERITGYSYEPWHIRYVGIELASHLYNNDLTLEEYYEFEIDPFYYNGITYDNISLFGIDPEDLKVKQIRNRPTTGGSTTPKVSPTPEISPAPEESEEEETEGETKATDKGANLPAPPKGDKKPAKNPTPSPKPTTTPTPTSTPSTTPSPKPTATPTPTPDQEVRPTPADEGENEGTSDDKKPGEETGVKQDNGLNN